MRTIWSRAAIRDLRDIRRGSAPRWGGARTARYLEEIRDAAHDVAADAERARPLNGRLRIVRAGSHYLIVDPDSARGVLTVARILHVRMDLDRHLP